MNDPQSANEPELLTVPAEALPAAATPSQAPAPATPVSAAAAPADPVAPAAEAAPAAASSPGKPVRRRGRRTKRGAKVGRPAKTATATATASAPRLPRSHPSHALDRAGKVLAKARLLQDQVNALAADASQDLAAVRSLLEDPLVAKLHALTGPKRKAAAAILNTF